LQKAPNQALKLYRGGDFMAIPAYPEIIRFLANKLLTKKAEIHHASLGVDYAEDKAPQNQIIYLASPPTPKVEQVKDLQDTQYYGSGQQFDLSSFGFDYYMGD
jgi:hypothetical protein